MQPPCQHFQHRLRRRDLLRHVNQLVPNHLMLRQGFSKGVTLLGVFGRVVEAHACSGDTARRHGQALALKLCVISRKSSPSSPSRFSAGTRHSSKCSVAVSEAHQPIFFSGVRDRPGAQ
jgi:hypothetical protein